MTLDEIGRLQNALFEAVQRFEKENKSTLSCMGCGKRKTFEVTVLSEQDGRLVVTGWREKAVGWLYMSDSETNKQACLCPDCKEKALEFVPHGGA